MDQVDIDKRKLELLKAADQLAASNPQGYGTFIRALANYAEVPNMYLMHADPSTILNAQGQARFAYDLTMLLAESKKNLEAMIARRSSQLRAASPRKTI